jgi:hypothetical protein
MSKLSAAEHSKAAELQLKAVFEGLLRKNAARCQLNHLRLPMHGIIKDDSARANKYKAHSENSTNGNISAAKMEIMHIHPDLGQLILIRELLHQGFASPG